MEESIDHNVTLPEIKPETEKSVSAALTIDSGNALLSLTTGTWAENYAGNVLPADVKHFAKVMVSGPPARIARKFPYGSEHQAD